MRPANSTGDQIPRCLRRTLAKGDVVALRFGKDVFQIGAIDAQFRPGIFESDNPAIDEKARDAGQSRTPLVSEDLTLPHVLEIFRHPDFKITFGFSQAFDGAD